MARFTSALRQNRPRRKQLEMRDGDIEGTAAELDLAAWLQGVEPYVVGCHILLLSPRNDAERVVGQRAL